MRAGAAPPVASGALHTMRRMCDRPTCVDLFCGAGGLSLGLRHAGFAVRAAVDSDATAIATYAENLGEHAAVADVAELRAADVLALAELDDGDLDLLAAGPPCQGFSKQKRGAHLGDRRNSLVLEFLRLVGELRPRAFLLENVSQLAQARGRHLVREFGGLDYELAGHFYVAADYGVAQSRERFVMVGLQRSERGRFRPPAPTSPAWPTVGEAIGDLPEPPADYTDHPEYPNHQAARVTAVNVERFSHVPQGGGWQDIPRDLRLACHKSVDVRRGGWPDVYGRLRWDGQCPTITGGFDSFTRGRYGHPRRNRPLTPREAARLQGFPDDFVFRGTRYDIRHQIGNAVPVPLAAAIGAAVVRALAGGEQDAAPGESLAAA
jgi:DNA (cytosine-5)-methyltransferase 1